MAPSRKTHEVDNTQKGKENIMNKEKLVEPSNCIDIYPSRIKKVRVLCYP